MPTPTPTSAALPDGIEIFRAGRHTADDGSVHEFSAADLADMAAGYNPAVREAPLCVGHPRDDLPAYGWVKSVARNAAGALTIDTHSVEPQFAAMVCGRRFPKRSASFYPPHSPYNPTPGKWYLRHVAFLGAQAPAIAGLKDISFSADDGDAVCFSLAVQAADPPRKESPVDEDEVKALQAQLQAERAARAAAEAGAAQARKDADAAAAQAASFAEKARADRQAAFASFAQAQVQAGRLLPKDQPMLAATLDLLADAQPVEFAQGGATAQASPVQWLQDLVARGPQVVNYGEFAPAHQGGGMRPGGARGKSDAEIDTAAQAYQAAHKVDYAQALVAVTATFTTPV